MGKTYFRSLVGSEEDCDRLIRTCQQILAGDRQIVLIYGAGNNGKSYFVNQFKQLFGPDEVTEFQPEFALGCCRNKKLAICQDPGDVDGLLNKLVLASGGNFASVIVLSNAKPIGKPAEVQAFQFTQTFTDPMFKISVDELRDCLEGRPHTDVATFSHLPLSERSAPAGL